MFAPGALKQCFSTWDDFVPQEAFGNVCSHFWLLRLVGRDTLMAFPRLRPGMPQSKMTSPL